MEMIYLFGSNGYATLKMEIDLLFPITKLSVCEAVVTIIGQLILDEFVKGQEISFFSNLDISNTWQSAPASVNQNHEYQVYPTTVTSRLASFRPLLFIEMPSSLFFTTLSSSGFSYTGRGITAECEGCSNNVELITFTSSPSGQAYHKPDCPFIDPGVNEANNLESQNVEQSALSERPMANTLEEHPDYSMSVQTVEQHIQQRDSELLSSTSDAAVALTNSSYPVFGNVEKRLLSFAQQWPSGHIHTPSELAGAGFFYAGYSDCVRCFHCGLGLRSWRPGDDIYAQHERFRPACQFLLTQLRNKSERRHERQSTQNGVSESVNVNNSRTFGSSTTLAASPQQEIPTSSTTEVQNTQTSDVEQSDAPRDNHHQDNDSTTHVTKTLLQRENEALKEQMKCKSCKTSPVQDLFLPCGDMYTCRNCSNKFTQCPSCGKRILGTVTVFFA